MRGQAKCKKERMAKVKLAPAVEAIHGHVGAMLFKRWENEEIVGKMPDRTGVVPTANQLAQQEKFRLAAIYGKAAIADPETKQLYTDVAKGRGVPVFALMVADFLNASAVDQVDLSAYTGKADEPIRARVSDDLQVTAVSVAIRSQSGDILEQGAAVKGADGLTWTYTTTTALAEGQAVAIEVTATDKPGNVATKTTNRA
jgi:hypothetical protein